ncbi:hypothetical protein Q1695_000791 [Nippostrongylus brasiliensis]|nr:hypothetical protein Q1695_000791 [Nippostrongylus brasiliensis]
MQQLYSQLNDDQRAATDELPLSFLSTHSNLHFIDGPGGSGKTFFYNALYNKGRDYNVINAAWTGIAVNLLPEGRTVCPPFKLNSPSLDDRSRRQQQRNASDFDGKPPLQAAIMK